MDLATIIGLALGIIGIVVGSILEGGNPLVMFHPAPITIVIVGGIGVSIMGITMGDAKRIPKMLIKVFTAKVNPPDKTLETLVSLADKARREGLLALEDAAKGIDDEFLKEGLQLAIDGTDPDALDEVMRAQIDAKRATEKQDAKFWADAGAFAPTIGICGTVLGLTGALQNLDDPTTLGHAISLALLATLWGVMSANVFFLPFANRIKRLTEIECKQMEMVVEGILAIQGGANPRVLARKLESLVGAKAPEKAAA